MITQKILIKYTQNILTIKPKKGYRLKLDNFYIFLKLNRTILHLIR